MRGNSAWWFLIGVAIGGGAVAGWMSEAWKDGRHLWQEIKALRRSRADTK